MTKLRDGRKRNSSSVPGMVRRFFCSSQCPGQLWESHSSSLDVYWGAVPPRARGAGRETDRSPPSKIKVMNA